MAKQKLTKRTVESIVPTDQDILVWDEALPGLCQTNANQVEFVIPGFRRTAQNTCDFLQPLGD